MPTKKKSKFRKLLAARMPDTEADRAVILEQIDERALPVWKSMQAKARLLGLKEGAILSVLIEASGPDLLKEIGDPSIVPASAVFVPGQD